MITIKTQHLKAATFCAPTKDIRTYLNAVHLVKTGANLTIESSDGPTAFRGNVTLQEDEASAPDWDVLVPIEIVKVAVKTKSPFVQLKHTNEQWQLENMLFAPVEGKFTDLNRVILTKTTGEIGQFSPDLLKQAHDAVKTWHGVKNDTFFLNHNGNGAALYKTEECLALVMGVNINKTPGERV